MRGEISPGEAASGVVIENDGYESGFFEEGSESDFFEEGSESDFSEDEDENLSNEREEKEYSMQKERTSRMGLLKYFGYFYSSIRNVQRILFRMLMTE